MPASVKRVIPERAAPGAALASAERLDVVAVGHAIVDVVSQVSDRSVENLGLSKGTMTLVDDLRSRTIYEGLGLSTAASGGSAANTAAAVASLGGAAAFVGKVADDELGRLFTEDIRAGGVRYEVAPSAGGPGTGRCMVMVTPDGEKTMCTCLGAGDLVGPEDLDTEMLASSKVVYLEGYLCGIEGTDLTVAAVMTAAEQAGAKISLSLSDPLWVELHGKDMDRLLDRVDILFANEEEACGVVGGFGLRRALESLGQRCAEVVVTRGERGAVVLHGGRLTQVEASPVDSVVDTTGAGDLFAAGYLYGRTHGFDPEHSARLGSLAAGEVVSHLGARPLGSLRQLAETAGLVVA